MSKNNSEYSWTIEEVRKLDVVLSEIKEDVKAGRVEIKEIQKDLQELKNRNSVVIDNTNKTDWKAIGVIVGATVASAMVALQQFVGGK